MGVEFPQKARRMLPGESSLEGLMRLKKERQEEIAARELYSWHEDLIGGIVGASKRLKHAQVGVFYENKPTDTELVLASHGKPIADMEVVTDMRVDRLSAMIEYFSGRKGKKEQLDRFMEDNNGLRWNVFLVDSVKEAAYHAGYDWILLRDIESTIDYRFPSYPASMTKKDVRRIMSGLYEKTAKECGMTKLVNVGSEPYSGEMLDYYAIKFP